MRKGVQTLVFESKPVILSRAAIGGKKEGEGPLAAHFDFLGKDAKLGQKTFEKAESKLQELALDTAKRKLGISYEDIDVLFAGDLLNQCISSSFAARGTSIPFLGLYGACSTMAESLLLAAAFVDAGFADTAAALTSSHFASAERQYRFPLGYGGQRTPTAQWTVTGAGALLLIASKFVPYVHKRIVSWRDPFADTSAAGYQIVQSLYSIGSGGFLGLGLGQSRQKYLYLPEEHNDYIFSIVCEELGFVGACAVVGLFVLLLWRGITIAAHAPDRFGALLVVGFTVQVALQAVLNVAVVTNTIPNTGISLPFFSSGGTSLMMLLGEMGIVLSVSRGES